MSANNEVLGFLDLMKQIDEEERAQRDRGTLFELLTKAYLENEPMYRQLFDSVWLLKDVPDKYGIPKKDTGVDLVAKKRGSDDLFAIQSKYYSSDYKIGKSDIDSFLNEIGKNYYSEGIIITSTPHWTNNAEDAINDRDKKVTRIDITKLKESRVDWSEFSFSRPEEVVLQAPKAPRPHQEDAIKSVLKGFETANRGKLIMAPGTGKTYTSMVIAERLAEQKKGKFKVLYLVPSIQLLSQALRGWSADTKHSLSSIAVCSDRKVTKKSGSNELEDIAAADIGYPATTDYKKLLKYQKDIESFSSNSEILTVFSTYQSIDVIIEAQEKGFYDFDLIVADEAHRTTGSTKSGEKDSYFVKVHKNSNIKAEKRLYQTATPRVYGEKAQQKASESSVLLYDMDEPELYGEEFYYLGFGEAVHKNILSDYKVMVLAVDESMVQKEMQHVFADENNELQFDDVTKIIGTWNGLLKRKNNSNELYGKPMKRAIAFTGTIDKSKKITSMYQQIINDFVENEDVSNAYKVDIKHADGSMNALQKNQKLDWLKAQTPERSVKILSNARFLTEGVDVPDLDAVLFLQPRKSEIDIAQAVGRVMRKAPGKEYGYIILPIGVPEGVSSNQVLDNNEKYSVIWDILNALRSIDERFDAIINKLELNKRKPDKIDVIGIESAPDVNSETKDYVVDDKKEQLTIDFDENWTDLEHAIYGKIVQKVGTTRYWETWSKDVAKIAEQHIRRINTLLESEAKTNKIFNEFLNSLRYNINESITEDSAVEMLAQHMITKPVFDALFEEESFALNNPVSQSMNKMVNRLEELGFSKDTEDLKGFYESVRLRAVGIDNLEAKQTIIVQLYEKFFTEAFPRTTNSLGIVFTPVEIVSFIVKSLDDVLQKYFNKELSNENVNILDPFTGTGTFITSLIQSGLISKNDLLRKYTQEIHANEIVLLSYYIAAINIEETFKEINEKENNDNSYVPFEGIVLTDTFATTEQEVTLDEDLFGDNNERLKRQKESPITVIMGNPPYSKGQKNENDNLKNQSYPKLFNSIKQTYVKESSSSSVRSMYDSYILSYRWAADRIGDSGVIGFVSNGSFIDSKSADGFRKSLFNEFNHLYILNLRGDQRTSGKKSREEGGKVFGSGSRAPIVITILVKDGSEKHHLYYKDIGDYLTTNEKLNIVKEFESIENIDWLEIIPDMNNDWINQRDERYSKFVPLADTKNSIFRMKDIGIVTNRDSWVTNFSINNIEDNVKTLIDNYNYEISKVINESDLNNTNFYNYFTNDSKKVSWSDTLKRHAINRKNLEFDKENILPYMYRPFTKKYLYRARVLNERPRKSFKTFPNKDTKNLFINVTGAGSKQDFSALASNILLDMNGIYPSRNLPRYTFEESTLFDDKIENISSDSDFYYVYGILHSKQYIQNYQNDLVKDLPKIPNVRNKTDFIEVGKKLMDLHVNYESVEPYGGLDITFKNENPSFLVEKMRFAKLRNTEGKLMNDRTSIIFNKDITVNNIPEKAYDYVINGRSAIEWIIDQYQVNTDDKSGITDNPNDYSDNPQYIFDLLLSIINVSVQTIDLKESLPALDIIQE